MNVYIPNLRLPSAYQEVEYIQSSGTQYIDTLYNPQTDTEFDITYELVSHIGADDCIFGCRKDYNMQAYYIGVHYQSGSETSYYGFGDSFTYPSSVTFSGIGVNRNITYKNGILSNGSQTSNVSINSTPYGNLCIFCDNHNGIKQEYCAIKLYSFKLTTSGTLVRDFVPCYRKSDNVIGLYDLVNSVFYTNQGTGTFSKGNDVTMAVLKNAYIGEYKGYSFDFRNKTQAQAEANGWTITGTYNSDANGWYSSLGSSLDKSIDIVGYNKITITAEMNIYSASSAGALCFGVGNESNRMREFTSGNTSSNRGIGFQIGSNRLGWDNYATISGATTLTYIIDFQNLSMSAKIVNGANERTRTQSFSSAQASAVQTSNATINIYPDNANHRLKILSYVIE